MATTYHPGAFEGQAGNMLQGAQASGFFDPTGSARITALTRRRALRGADNARRRAAILSRLYGLDPNQSQQALVNADTEASGATQEAMNQAQLGQLFQNQDYFRNLFGQQLGNEQQRNMLRYQRDLNRPTLGGQIGGLIGQGAGAFLGGYGANLGAGMGQRRQPPPNMTEAYDPYQREGYYG